MLRRIVFQRKQHARDTLLHRANPFFASRASSTPSSHANPKIFQHIAQRGVRLIWPRFKRETICQIVRQFCITDELL